VAEGLFDKDIDSRAYQSSSYRQVSVCWGAHKGRIQFLVLDGFVCGTIKGEAQAHTSDRLAKRSIPIHQGDHLGLRHMLQYRGMRKTHPSQTDNHDPDQRFLLG
jgi:hypothetical protein